MSRELLDLKLVHLILLGIMENHPRTSREIIDRYSMAFPMLYTIELNKDLLNDQQLFAMIRHMGQKGLIQRDTSRRWALTGKGKVALDLFSITSQLYISQRQTSYFFNSIWKSEGVANFFPGEFHNLAIACIEPIISPEFSPANYFYLRKLRSHTFLAVDCVPNSSKLDLGKKQKLMNLSKQLLSYNPQIELLVGYLGEKTYYLAEDGMHFAEIEDESQDYIFTEFLVQISIDPLQALEELYRILKPGGRILLNESNLTTLLLFDSARILDKTSSRNSSIEKLVGFQQRQFSKREEINSLIRRSPFEVISIVELNNMFPGNLLLILEKPR